MKKVNGDENGRGLMTMMTTMAGGEERVGEVKKKKIDSGRLRERGRKKIETRVEDFLCSFE